MDGGYAIDYSFSESLKSRTLALVERAFEDDSAGVNSYMRKPIDMSIIERIKALRRVPAD